MSAQVLDDDEIRKRLLEHGFNCGPVTDSTRAILLKKLSGLTNKKGDGKSQGRIRCCKCNSNVEVSNDQCEPMDVD